MVHLQNGMGAIAQTLADTVQRHGGQVLYRQQAHRIIIEEGRPIAVETKRRNRIESFPANLVIANLPPWNIVQLLAEHRPASLHKLPPKPKDGWGAFMVYVGVDDGAIPADFPLHHQVIVQEPLAEGNTVFLSLSPAWDKTRAPTGQRALTLSTHTQLADWWDLFEQDPAAYQARESRLYHQDAGRG